MRTTITLDAETHEFATIYAEARGLTLSKAIAELIRKAQAEPASAPAIRLSPLTGLPTFPPSGRILTSQMVKELEEEEFDPRLFA